MGIANICYVVNPEVVVLGGGIMAQKEYLKDILRESLDKYLIRQLPGIPGWSLHRIRIRQECWEPIIIFGQDTKELSAAHKPEEEGEHGKYYSADGSYLQQLYTFGKNNSGFFLSIIMRKQICHQKCVKKLFVSEAPCPDLQKMRL